MASKIIVTNLRIPEEEWLAGKILASEYGISTNALMKLSKIKGGKPLGPLSEEDRIIYEVAQ